jgi:hypothetical protein
MEKTTQITCNICTGTNKWRGSTLNVWSTAEIKLVFERLLFLHMMKHILSIYVYQIKQMKFKINNRLNPPHFVHDLDLTTICLCSMI